MWVRELGFFGYEPFDKLEYLIQMFQADILNCRLYYLKKLLMCVYGLVDHFFDETYIYLLQLIQELDYLRQFSQQLAVSLIFQEIINYVLLLEDVRDGVYCLGVKLCVTNQLVHHFKGQALLLYGVLVTYQHRN